MPIVYIGKNDDETRTHFIETVRSRVGRGDRIGILFPMRRDIQGYAEALTNAGLEVEVPLKLRGQEETLTHDFGSNRPKLMPYHSAKGLTFDTVMMPLFQKRKFPKFLSEELRERLLFVAITRATKWFYVGAPNEVMYEEQWNRLEQQGQLTIQRGEENSEISDEEPESNDLSDLF